MSNNNFEDLLEQIEKWHEEDEHSNIIEAVLDISDSDRSYELTCLLARAYNNLDEYENALNLLLSVKDEGKYDVLWHFRIGYAYYYLDYLEDAETAFNRVLESDPENEDAIDFITWIQEEIEDAAAIKPNQEKAAFKDMIEWLSHENELGTAPSEIEHAGEFDLHSLHYYIFKYKKPSDEADTGKKSNAASSPWLLGVAGGYSRFDLEHCGHVFSEMEEYSPKNAEEKAIALVEMLREAWRAEAEKELEARGLNPDDLLISDETDASSKIGPFSGFVLLESHDFDTEQIKANLRNDWDIHFKEEKGSGDPDISDEFSLVFNSDGMMAAISFIEMPVPNGEAERFAEANYMWEDAVSETKKHVAQILVVVFNREQSAIDAAKLHSKITSCCLKLENAVGVYTAGTVFQPEYYIEMADLMREEDLPIPNWVYFGIYTSESGTNGYTYGLRLFGKEEIEIIGSIESPESVHDFLANISYYILKEDVNLKTGETVGFTELQKFEIKKSKGVALDGYTFKIDY